MLTVYLSTSILTVENQKFATLPSLQTRLTICHRKENFNVVSLSVWDANITGWQTFNTTYLLVTYPELLFRVQLKVCSLGVYDFVSTMSHRVSWGIPQACLLGQPCPDSASARYWKTHNFAIGNAEADVAALRSGATNAADTTCGISGFIFHHYTSYHWFSM
jgi:hypothetical protein